MNVLASVWRRTPPLRGPRRQNAPMIYACLAPDARATGRQTPNAGSAITTRIGRHCRADDPRLGERQIVCNGMQRLGRSVMQRREGRWSELRRQQARPAIAPDTRWRVLILAGHTRLRIVR